MSAPVGPLTPEDILAVLSRDWQRTAAIAVALGRVTAEQASVQTSTSNEACALVAQVDLVRGYLERMGRRVERTYEVEHPNGSRQYLQWRLAS